MKIKCSRCSQFMREGDMVKASIISTYHELAGKVDSFTYAIDRPHAAMNVQHLVCHSED
jgi:hypothetical protein